MSIQSEITRISGEVASQSDLISQISAALEGKVSSGGSHETWTITPVDGSKLEQNTSDLQSLLAAVNNLPEPSAPVLQEKTVTPTTSQQTVMPDADYDGLSKVVVGAMPTATQATPTITVSADGLVTASVTQSEGYVSAGTKNATKQLTTQAAQTIVPGTANQTIGAGKYLTGAQTIAGDANLLPENIVSGVSIFGVAGAAQTGGGDAGEGDAANNIFALKLLDVNYAEVFAFRAGMTWLEFYNSWLCPYVYDSSTGDLKSVVLVDEGAGDVMVCLCNPASYEPYIYRHLNANMNDVIESFIDSGYIYEVE